MISSPAPSKANTALQILEEARQEGVDIAADVAKLAQEKALALVRAGPISLDVVVIDRAGTLLARTPALSHDALPRDETTGSLE